MLKSPINQSSIRLLLDTLDLNGYEFSRVETGVSTIVYKLTSTKAETQYLRILNDGESAKPQVFAHNLLIEQGLIVPKVTFTDDFSSLLNNRSYMIVTEILGKSICNKIHKINEEILRAAGRAIGIVNTIPCTGFGDISRVDNGSFVGFVDSYAKFVLSKTENSKKTILDNNKGFKSLDAIIKQVYCYESYFNETKSFLNHGDFDCSHIYSQGAHFTGLIDFGDLRGASQIHDICHYNVFTHIGFKYVLEGYNTVIGNSEGINEYVDIESKIFAINIMAFGIAVKNQHLIDLGEKYLKNTG